MGAEWRKREKRKTEVERGTDLGFHTIIICCCIVSIPSVQQLGYIYTHTHTHTRQRSRWDMPEIVVVMVKVGFSWPEH